MLNNKLRGTGVALVTPFSQNNEIDFEALENLINFILKGKVDFLVLLGTTSESPTLTVEEKKQIVLFVKEKVNNQVPLVVGLSGNDSYELVKTIKSFDLSGVSAILTASPSYNKPTQEGIYQHYKLIAENSPIPIILYNIPSRTGSTIKSDTTIRLAKDFKNIIGIKEASGCLERAMIIIKNTDENFSVLSGDDMMALPIITLGGDGVISVIGNAFPSEYTKMVNLALSGNIEEAREIHYKLFEIMRLLFVDGNPAGIKSALSILNICSDSVRLPLIKATEETHKKLSQHIY